MTKPAPLGPYNFSLRCNRLECEEPAGWHAMWDQADSVGVENSLVCDGHHAEALSYGHQQIHRCVPDCGMPGAMWYPDEGTCRADEFGETFTSVTTAESQSDPHTRRLLCSSAARAKADE